MDFYRKMLIIKASNKIGYRAIGEVIDMKEGATRMAFDRKSFSELEIRELTKHFKLEKNQDSKNSDKVEETETNYSTEEGFYVDQKIFNDPVRLLKFYRFVTENHELLAEDSIYQMHMQHIRQELNNNDKLEELKRKAAKD